MINIIELNGQSIDYRQRRRENHILPLMEIVHHPIFTGIETFVGVPISIPYYSDYSSHPFPSQTYAGT